MVDPQKGTRVSFYKVRGFRVQLKRKIAGFSLFWLSILLVLALRLLLIGTS